MQKAEQTLIYSTEGKSYMDWELSQRLEIWPISKSITKHEPVWLVQVNKCHHFESLISFAGCCACSSCNLCLLQLYQDYAATSTGLGSLQVSELHDQTFIWPVWNMEWICLGLKRNLSCQKRCTCVRTGFEDIQMLRRHFMHFMNGKCHSCTCKCSKRQKQQQ